MKSILATIDIETGTETVLYETDRHLEAPNWTPDGAATLLMQLARSLTQRPGLFFPTGEPP